jgi:hypothetical protein
LLFSELTWQPGYTPLRTLGDLIEYNKENYELEFQGGPCCRGDPAYALYYQQSWEASQLTGDKRDPAYVGAKMVSAEPVFSFLSQNETRLSHAVVL